MNLAKLKEEQRKFAQKIITKRTNFDKRYIVGCVAVHKKDKIISVAVLCDYNSMRIIEKSQKISSIDEPYLFGFRSFQDGPDVVDVIKRLDKKPDLIMVLGHGISHIHRFGIASYIGLTLDISTVGVAKNLQFGEVKDGRVFINLEMRGKEVQTKPKSNPLCVSIGHNMSLTQAVNVVKETMRPPHKLPEPLHIAQKIARRVN